jgi:hypothetical protein
VRYKGLVTGAEYPVSPDSRVRYMDVRDFAAMKPGVFVNVQDQSKS